MEVVLYERRISFFKGTKEGVYVYVKDGSFVNVKKELERKLKESLSFLKVEKLLILREIDYLIWKKMNLGIL